MSESISGTKNLQLKQDFALLFIIRTIFLGFVQKKLWLNGDEEFIQNYWLEYKEKYNNKNLFYDEWLRPLFFESLNYPPGRKVFNHSTPFSENTALALQMAPFLNGELFKEKIGIDDQNLSVPDIMIEHFFAFLFSYNFTIEENTLYDQELELNPEFLGIIFERLVNKEDGAVYTPRTEVDFMCRISLVKWLQNTSNVHKKKLYHLFFDKHYENKKDELLETDEKKEVFTLLKNITVCDPAAGSGAFPVGMLQVLDESIQLLSEANSESAFERKKEIISRSLYGVEVKAWAVWINQLRLWLSLFIDMPDEFNKSFEPLLPNLEFKIRRGDSLVQKIGDKLFTVDSHANLSPQLKSKITLLKKDKADFFFGRNRLNAKTIRKKENDIFKEILEEQILEKKRTLNAFSTIGTQSEMFDVPQKEELRLQIDEKKKVQLIEEIKILEEELKSFKEVHPLIWNIEFAEIFFNKNGFDIIIGNPPYVRQVNISDPDNKLNANDYKELLRQTIYDEYPTHFYVKENKSKLKNKIDGKSDLYTFFYLKSLKLLNENGVHTFICSNSWLDVGYGAWLQQFILENTKLHFVIDNQFKRSFSSADINTIITVLDSPVKKQYIADPEHKAKFIVFKRPYEEILNTENLLLNEYAETITKDDDFRVYPITYKELKEAGTIYENVDDKKLAKGIYEGDKWGGKYLRAPDIFFTVIEKGKDKLIPLGTRVEFETYLNTGGADDFFFVEKISKHGSIVTIKNKKFNILFEVEDKYLKTFIESPTQISRRKIDDDSSYSNLIVITNDENISNKKIKNYIDWGETIGFNKASGRTNKEKWWVLPKQAFQTSELIVPCRFNDSHYFCYNPSLIISHRFYRLYFSKDYLQLSLILNSTFTSLFLEIFTPNALGLGVLDINTLVLSRILIINNLTFSPHFIKENKILERNIIDIITELGFDKTKPIRSQKPNPLPDRKALDDIIFDALGLTKAEREEVYYSVCELVQNRLNKARSV